MKTKAYNKWAGRVIRTRRAGMVYIFTSIFLGVVSVNSSNNLLYLVTAMMLGYMLASGIAGRGNIRGASVSVSFPDEIYASVPCAVGVNVYNKNRFTPIFLIEVALEQGNSRTSAFFPVVQPGRTESRMLLTAFPSRGRRSFEEIELSSVYPFNFFTRYWPVDADAEVTVFPYPLACDLEAVLPPMDKDEREGEIAGSLAEADIVGVRPYVEGDSMKRIHWKSSARTGKLHSRLYDGTLSYSHRRVIDLDRLTSGGVERGLAMAAYILVESIKSKLPIGMRYGGEFIPPASDYAHKKELLTRLALYEELK
ncbi:MAG: DUF58 domain-containing protein [Synergistaceae bacterium]|nr:DUF58 domain-containing protein [Synergistaceae bacterium]